MKRSLVLSLALALGFASAVFAQTGKSMQYSNAPTDTGYRLTIIEPRQGATITGKDVNIVLSLPAMPTGNLPQSSATELKERSMNTPVFQVWVDGKNMGNLPGGTNVFYARDLPYGPHKIVVMAKNNSGEVVDRKEVSITTAEFVNPVTITHSPVAAPEPAPAPALVPAAEAEPAPEPPPAEELPQTATSYPLAAAAGLVLIGAGILVRRLR